jgi:hypothetical protein
VPNSDLQGDTGSQAVAEDVGVFDPKLLECGGSAICSIDSGRSMSAVCPWACISKAIPRRVLASSGRTFPNEVPIAEKAP